MIAERKSSFIWLLLLIVLILVYQTGLAIYAVEDLEPLPAFDFLFRAAFLCGVVWWLRAEAKNSELSAPYCEGLLVSLGWVVLMPYYLIKSRGVSGLIQFLALLGAFVVSEIVATIIRVIFSMPV